MRFRHQLKPIGHLQRKTKTAIIREPNRLYLLFGNRRMIRRFRGIERTRIVDQNINRSPRLDKRPERFRLDEIESREEANIQIIKSIDIAIGVMGRGQRYVGGIKDVMVGRVGFVNHIIGVEGVVYIVITLKISLFQQETITNGTIGQGKGINI